MKHGCTVVGSDTVRSASADYETYFVDLLTIKDLSTVRRVLVEPMIEMFQGNRDFIVTNKVPVLKV